MLCGLCKMGWTSAAFVTEVAGRWVLCGLMGGEGFILVKKSAKMRGFLRDEMAVGRGVHRF